MDNFWVSFTPSTDLGRQWNNKYMPVSRRVRIPVLHCIVIEKSQNGIHIPLAKKRILEKATVTLHLNFTAIIVCLYCLFVYNYQPDNFSYVCIHKSYPCIFFKTLYFFIYKYLKHTICLYLYL